MGSVMKRDGSVHSWGLHKRPHIKHRRRRHDRNGVNFAECASTEQSLIGVIQLSSATNVPSIWSAMDDRRGFLGVPCVAHDERFSALSSSPTRSTPTAWSSVPKTARNGMARPASCMMARMPRAAPTIGSNTASSMRMLDQRPGHGQLLVEGFVGNESRCADILDWRRSTSVHFRRS